MADPATSAGPAGLLPAEKADRLLAGIDAAFEQTVHGRYGGGIEILMLRDGGLPVGQVLRGAAAGSQDRIQLLLYPSVDGNPASSGHGTTVGEVRLSGVPPMIDEVSIFSEISDPKDPNQGSDTSAFGAGVLFAQGDCGLVVVRSTEEESAAGRAATRQQRGFLAGQQRHGGRAHRRAVPYALAVSVTAEILGRLGTAVAGLGGDGTDPDAPNVAKMALLVALDVGIPF